MNVDANDREIEATFPTLSQAKGVPRNGCVYIQRTTVITWTKQLYLRAEGERRRIQGMWNFHWKLASNEKTVNFVIEWRCPKERIEYLFNRWIRINLVSIECVGDDNANDALMNAREHVVRGTSVRYRARRDASRSAHRLFTAPRYPCRTWLIRVKLIVHQSSLSLSLHRYRRSKCQESRSLVYRSHHPSSWTA